LSKMASNVLDLVTGWFKKYPIRKAVCLLLLVILIVFPFLITNRFYVALVTEILIYGLVAMSLDILLGYTGLLSFMHCAYLGIGAYTVGLFLVWVDPSASVWLLLLLGTVMTALIALPIGCLQVRAGGFAFALLTIAFGMMYYTVVWKWRSLTGGDDGLVGISSPHIAIGNWVIGSLDNPTTMYLFTLFIVLICFFIAWRIVHSPLGAVLESIRENEERASFIGINVRRYKLMGWMLACTLAGVGGVLFTLLRSTLAPNIMDASAGGAVLMMVLLGGLGTLWGPFIGAAVFIFGQDYISTMTEHWMIFLGLIVILLVIFMPRGLAGLKDYLYRGKKE